jgi:hypothetical protein
VQLHVFTSLLKSSTIRCLLTANGICWPVRRPGLLANSRGTAKKGRIAGWQHRGRNCVGGFGDGGTVRWRAVTVAAKLVLVPLQEY